MGRNRKFTDREFKKVWDANDGVAKEVAKVLEVTLASVYQHASRLKLKTTRAALTGTLNPQPGDRDILRSFTHRLTLKQLARMNGLTPYDMKKRLMLIVNRLWVNVNNYSEFPKPESASDIQVFNFIYSIPADRFIDEAPAREDVTYILKHCSIREDLVIDYHTRYLDHLGEIEQEYNEGSRRRPHRKTSLGQKMRGTNEHPRYKKKKKKFVPKRAARSRGQARNRKALKRKSVRE